MLKQGSIIRARVYDPQGQNPKIRPLVVVTPTAEISETAPIAVVAITGEIGDPPADDEIELPFHPRGTSLSRLTKRCVAKCTWQESIVKDDVVEQKGFLETKYLTRILNKISEIDAAECEPNQN